MTDAAETLALLAEYEELVRYCPVLAVDPALVRDLDRHTLQVLSRTARGNSRNQRELQKQGIAQAKAHGVQFGRPKAKIPEDFRKIVEAWQQGNISRVDAIRQSGLSTATFYRYLKKVRNE